MLNIEFNFKVVSTLSLVPHQANAGVSDEKRVESSGPSPKTKTDKKGFVSKTLVFMKKVATAIVVKKVVELLSDIIS
ncbi:hypothetical protein [Endozoicomonas euniceicola]|uniref:Uncharacterized protein n=1 Tax=Endozoicomonas euniceicola TaxID=1234143 RepID=A0ABY6GR27_9GAMM|nr:hypothetical protein [Endozoicomonas euniceicola]UYM15200.1 hypothetical protein NX720_20410 [Endozoicomonas euniceicola]